MSPVTLVEHNVQGIGRHFVVLLSSCTNVLTNNDDEAEKKR